MPSTETLALIGGVPVIPRGLHQQWPIIRNDDHRALSRVLDRGILCGSQSPEVTGLQKEWAWFCEARFCLATSSGTSALHCAVAAAGVRAGDEVIVPALSFIASAFAVAHQGAVPVFCDIDGDTYNIDPSKIEALITARTSAIVVVHVHGLPSDMDAIHAIADRHGLRVIEDAAQAHGATYKGRRVGTLGHTAAFSLNATKILVGGEGGLMVTNDELAFKTAKRLALFGEDGEVRGTGHAPTYLSHGLGYNYRCSEMTAALARSQLRYLTDVLARCQANAAQLQDSLRETKGLSMPVVPFGTTSAWHKFRVRLRPAEFGYSGDVQRLRDLFVRALIAEGVAASLWQQRALPANPAFLRDGVAPWSSEQGDSVGTYDSEAFPVTDEALRSTLILGSERAPLCAQSESLMSQYVNAIEKVIRNVDVLMSLPDVEVG